MLKTGDERIFSPENLDTPMMKINSIESSDAFSVG
jgi:hypothetical protein